MNVAAAAWAAYGVATLALMLVIVLNHRHRRQMADLRHYIGLLHGRIERLEAEGAAEAAEIVRQRERWERLTW